MLKKFLFHGLVTAFLTLFSQVGGLIWLASVGLHFAYFKTRKRRFVWPLFFVGLHLLTTFFIIPPLAKLGGRVPLPLFSNARLRPENPLFFFLNRNFVRPELKKAAEEVAEKMQVKFPGTTVFYLDGCFPFVDGWPLEPHFSHRDGKKLDVAFYWKTTDEHTVRGTPSPFGYGACEAARPDEYDYNEDCQKQGFWYISMTRQIAEPFFDESKFEFDHEKNRELARLFAENQRIRLILIEPHLKKRFGFEAVDKLRRQGCRAARHDDHLHVQL